MLWKKNGKNHFLICHNWQNTQLMGQKSLKGSDRTPFNLLRLCFEWCLFWLLFLIQFGAYTIGSYTLGPFRTYHVYKYILLLLGTCGEQVMCCWYTPKWLSRCVFGKTHWFLWGKCYRVYRAIFDALMNHISPSEYSSYALCKVIL